MRIQKVAARRWGFESTMLDDVQHKRSTTHARVSGNNAFVDCEYEDVSDANNWRAHYDWTVTLTGADLMGMLHLLATKAPKALTQSITSPVLHRFLRAMKLSKAERKRAIRRLKAA